MALSHEESELINEVNINKEWELLETFSKLVRVSGTEDERKGAHYIADKLQSYGIKTTVYDPELFISQPISASVSILEPENRQFKHDKEIVMNPKTSAFSKTGMYEGEIVYVRSNASVDNPFNIELEKTVDVRDKAVLTDGMLFEAVAWEAQTMGAKAILTIAPGKATHEGIITSIWGMPTLQNMYRIPNIIAATLSHEDGEYLKKLLLSGKRVKIRVATETNTGWFKCPIVVAEILAAKNETKEFVLLHGHHDSWHVGIGDNAVGDAAMLEVARVLQINRDKLVRNVRIAWWSGHSTGRYGGSTWFADNFALDLWENCVAQLNCDSPGCRYADAYDEVMWMDEVEQLGKGVIADVSGKVAKGRRPERAGDYSFNGVGVPGLFMLLSNMTREKRDQLGYYGVGGCGGNLEWHTEEDKIHVADREILRLDTQIYLTAVFRLATARLLPVDYRSTVKRSIEIISSYQRDGNSEFDMRPIIEEFNLLLKELEKMYSRNTGHLSGEEATQFNRVLRQISHILIPLNYTKSGRFDHDEALDVPPYPALFLARMLPSLKTKDRNQYLFLRNQLLRSSNNTIAAIRDARREVGLYLGSSTLELKPVQAV